MSRLYIAIPCHGRAKLAYECIRTIDEARYDDVSGASLNNDILALYEDGENQMGQAESCADEIHRSPIALGIDAQRVRHFIDFWNRRERDGLTHLYLADADAPHDPSWRESLLRLQGLFGGSPICGYRTDTHAKMANNIYHDNPAEGVLFQRFAPGVSYLLTREHVAAVMERIHLLRDWDWMVPSILGYKFAVSRVSYVDHIGIGGQHDPIDGSLGLEQASHPTEWLKNRRQQILAALCPPAS